MSMRRIIDLVESESEESSKDAWKSWGFKSPEAYNVWRYLSSPAMERVVDNAFREDKFLTGGERGSFGARARGNYDYTPAERIMAHFGAAEGQGPKSGDPILRKTNQKLPDGTPVTWAAVKEAMASIKASIKNRQRIDRENAKSRKKWGGY